MSTTSTDPDYCDWKSIEAYLTKSETENARLALALLPVLQQCGHFPHGWDEARYHKRNGIFSIVWCNPRQQLKSVSCTIRANARGRQVELALSQETVSPSFPIVQSFRYSETDRSKENEIFQVLQSFLREIYE
jgi:hypothetical protein